jgi:putative phage-type endonuclease
MGESPWSTPFMLWAEKCGVLPKEEPNSFALAAMERGKKLEPQARAQYVKDTGIEMEADVNCEHPQYPFLRASLDGYSEKHDLLLEIKCAGKQDHASAIGGKIPTKYFPQVQMQLLVTGSPRCDYYSYDGERGIVVGVLADRVYQTQMLQELLKFWRLVQDVDPPKVVPKDLERIGRQLLDATAKLQRLAQAYEVVRKALTVSPTRSGAKTVGTRASGDDMETVK